MRELSVLTLEFRAGTHLISQTALSDYAVPRFRSPEYAWRFIATPALTRAIPRRSREAPIGSLGTIAKAKKKMQPSGFGSTALLPWPPSDSGRRLARQRSNQEENPGSVRTRRRCLAQSLHSNPMQSG